MNPSSGTGDGITKFPAQSSASLFGNLSATIGVSENRHCDLHWRSPAACALFRVWFCCCLAAIQLNESSNKQGLHSLRFWALPLSPDLTTWSFFRTVEIRRGLKTMTLACELQNYIVKECLQVPVKSRYRKHDLVSFGLLCIYPHADALIKRHESRCSKTRSEDNLVCLVRRPIR